MKGIISLSTRILLLGKIGLFVLISLFLLAIPEVGYSIIILILVVHLAFFIGDMVLCRPFIYVKNDFLYKLSYLRIIKLNKLEKDYEIKIIRNHFDLFIDDKFCCSIYDFQCFWLIPFFLDKRKNRLDKKIKKVMSK